jgi:hypothetical protein
MVEPLNEQQLQLQQEIAQKTGVTRAQYNSWKELSSQVANWTDLQTEEHLDAMGNQAAYRVEALGVIWPKYWVCREAAMGGNVSAAEIANEMIKFWALPLEEAESRLDGIKTVVALHRAQAAENQAGPEESKQPGSHILAGSGLGTCPDTGEPKTSKAAQELYEQKLASERSKVEQLRRCLAQIKQMSGGQFQDLAANLYVQMINLQTHMHEQAQAEVAPKPKEGEQAEGKVGKKDQPKQDDEDDMD